MASGCQIHELCQGNVNISSSGQHEYFRFGHSLGSLRASGSRSVLDRPSRDGSEAAYTWAAWFESPSSVSAAPHVPRSPDNGGLDPRNE